MTKVRNCGGALVTSVLRLGMASGPMKARQSIQQLARGVSEEVRTRRVSSGMAARARGPRMRKIQRIRLERPQRLFRYRLMRSAEKRGRSLSNLSNNGEFSYAIHRKETGRRLVPRARTGASSQQPHRASL